jgi:hypothetical protein
MTRTLVVLASIALAITLVVAYADRAAFDSDQFANRATAALDDERVRTLVARRITDNVVLRQADDLLAARPIIESVASGVVGSTAFTQLFRASVRDVHRAIFKRDQNTVTLTVADVGTVMAAALRELRPALAKKIEDAGRVQLVKQRIGSVAGTLARLAERVKVLTLLLLVLTAALVAAALATAPDRRRAAGALGMGAATAGVTLLVTYAVARAVIVGQVDGAEAREAGRAVWDAFLGDLRSASWILAAAGLIIAASAASLLEPLQAGATVRKVADWAAREPRRPALRALRALGLIAAGIVAIAERDEVVALVVALAGLFLIVEGVSALLRLVYREPKPGEAPAGGPRWAALRPLAVVAIAGVVIAALAGGFVAAGGTDTPPPAITGACNGSVDLCDKTLGEVALPATHNSMAVPLPGWFAAEQEAPIATQLDDGVRGLLVDTHYADRLSNGRLRTDFGSPEELRRRLKQDGLSDASIAAAKRIRGRLGFAGEGKRGMYLCHSFCELGGTRLEPVLDDIRDFLVSHPEDVLVVINQDYVTPEDFTGAVRDAGLADFVYRGPATGELPTLREMIDAGERVVFLAENKAGGEPWYRLAYQQMTEETPYTFPRAADLTAPARLPPSCEPNRGPADAPVFLLNHWVSTDPRPLPADARRVNAYDPLLARARECAQSRAHTMNLVAVNFYRQGDLFRVVDTLNGVR